MPTRPTKGDHGHADRGSHERGNQKAVYGSAVSPSVGRWLRRLLGAVDEDVVAADEPTTRRERRRRGRRSRRS